MIKGIVLHASLFLTGDPQFQKSLIEENRALEIQVQTLKRELNDLKTSSIGKHTSNTPLVAIKTLLNKIDKGAKEKN